MVEMKNEIDENLTQKDMQLSNLELFGTRDLQAFFSSQAQYGYW
ncbi:MAG: hypothetical protein ACP5N2_02250 [Candidatus Nanoarchaeia archaeon]